MAASFRVPTLPTTPRSVLLAAPCEIEAISESQVLEIVDFLSEPDLESEPEILELSATDLAIEPEPEPELFVGPAASIPQMEADAFVEDDEPEDEAEDNDEAWAARIADAKVADPPPSAVETAPAAAPIVPASIVPAPVAPAPHVPSDRMRAVEALSTVAPWVSAADSMVAPVGNRRSVGIIVGVSAALSAAIVAIAFLLSADGAPTEVAVEKPAVVVHSAVLDEAEPPQPIQPVAAPSSVVPDKARARRLAAIGHRQLKSGNTANAANIFEDSLAANPRCRLAHEGLGAIALKRKRYGKAVEHLRAAVKVEPRNARNRRLLGDAYAGLGRNGKAEDQYAKATQYGDRGAKASAGAGGGGVATANPF